MGQATGVLLRERIIQLKQEGYSLFKISEDLSLTYSNVCSIWSLYQKEGHLQTKYSNCGKSKPSRNDVVYRACIWLKRLHLYWGTPRIHSGLHSRYGDQVPSIRTLNRWLRNCFKISIETF